MCIVNLSKRRLKVQMWPRGRAGKTFHVGRILTRGQNNDLRVHDASCGRDYPENPLEVNGSLFHTSCLRARVHLYCASGTRALLMTSVVGKVDELNPKGTSKRYHSVKFLVLCVPQVMRASLLVSIQVTWDMPFSAYLLFNHPLTAEPEE